MDLDSVSLAHDIAVLPTPNGDMLIAVVQRGEDIEAAIRAEEARAAAEFDRDSLVIHECVALVDEIEDGDEVVFESGNLGDIVDRDGVRRRYAVKSGELKRFLQANRLYTDDLRPARLRDLIVSFDATVAAMMSRDDRRGRTFGLSEEALAEYGDEMMQPLARPHVTRDGHVCLWAGPEHIEPDAGGFFPPSAFWWRVLF